MTWNNSDGYVEYKQALNYLENSLGITKFNFVLRQELAPYITRILQYINKNLIVLGDDVSMIDKLQEVFNTFDYGANLIIGLDTEILANEVGVLEEGEGDIEYEQDRFVFSWSNTLTSLVERLKLQYASLLYQAPEQGCGCSCANGETWKDFESYSSGIWPEDEEYSTYDFEGVKTNPYTSTSGCSCGGQRMKNSYNNN